MSDEQINIAIAEHCGWKEIRLDETHHIYGGIEPDNGFRVAIPNYCKNLNAMHEAEKEHILIDSILTDKYSHNLYDASDLPSFSSTARQRAEVFLKTIGKWNQK